MKMNRNLLLVRVTHGFGYKFRTWFIPVAEKSPSFHLIRPAIENQRYPLQSISRALKSSMSDQRVIVVEVTPPREKNDEQHYLEKEIDLAEDKIERLQDEKDRLNKRIGKLDQKTKNLTKSNERFEEVLDRSQQEGASRRALKTGLESLKQSRETCLENEKTLLELDLEALGLLKKIREWEVYREKLKTRQEEMRFEEWMSREEGLRYEDWKKSKYS